MSGFYVIDDGVISLSLKTMTIVYGLAISITLLAELIVTCTDGTFTCTLDEFPMVSTVIALEMYDRIFILLTAIFMFGVH